METTTEGVVEGATPVDEAARQDAEWTARMEAADRAWQAHRAREAELLPLNKTALFDALGAGGVVSVVITFDGCGDSGQLEDITAYAGDAQPLGLPGGTIAFQEIGFDAAEPSVTAMTVGDVLEKLAFDLLEETYGGWENNDGGYGEFTFDVAARSIGLDFNERYTATNHYSHEF